MIPLPKYTFPSSLSKKLSHYLYRDQFYGLSSYEHYVKKSAKTLNIFTEKPIRKYKDIEKWGKFLCSIGRLAESMQAFSHSSWSFFWAASSI